MYIKTLNSDQGARNFNRNNNVGMCIAIGLTHWHDLPKSNEVNVLETGTVVQVLVKGWCDLNISAILSQAQ